MATVATLAYLAASVLFILALRGLSHPESSRQGLLYGMIGMGVAVLATLLKGGIGFGAFALIVLAVAIGGLPLDREIDLAPVDGDVARGRDPEPDLVAGYRQDRDLDLVADHDALVRLPG